MCRGGAKKPSRALDVLYPVEKVYGRQPPKDAEGRTWANVRMKPDEHQKWFADTKRFINYADTKTAKADPDWLANRHVYTLRECERHGPFVMRQDMQSGCLRCAQGERCADSVEAEPDKECKPKKKRSKHYVINEWLGDVSDDDDDDYSDMKDFICEDVHEEFTDEKQEYETLFRRKADDWDACEWEAYLIQHCPTARWNELQARVLKRKRE